MNKITTKTYGNLLLDEIIFADYEPIIFTVKDLQNNLYICTRICPNPKELLIKKMFTTISYGFINKQNNF